MAFIKIVLANDSVDVLSDVDTTTASPNLNDVLKWDGTNFVPGTAGDTTEFTFTLDSFTASGISGTLLIGAGEFKAVGAIQFDSGYTNPPGSMTALVALTGSSSAWASDLSMTGTPPDGPTTNTEAVDYPNGRTGSLTFTITPSDSPTPTTLTDVQAFSNTMRYGTNANTIGNQTEANIEALSEVSGPNESRSQTISNIATDAGNYLTFSYADSLSDVAQIRMNSGNGAVTASFNATVTTLAPTVQTGITNVANSNSFSETFAAITSRLASLTDGSNDFTLMTSSTAQNYLFWGELNKASSYTEADVEDNISAEPGQLASNTISSRDMQVTTASDEYVYIAYPARLGALTSILIDTAESIDDFTLDSSTLAITNDAGYQENYRVYTSNNVYIGSGTLETMTVTI